MVGLPEILVIAAVGLLRFWLLPKYLTPRIQRTSSWAPRWLWVVVVPSLVVLAQWIRNPNAEGWVYGLGAGAGAVLGLVCWLAPQQPPNGSGPHATRSA